MIINKNQCCKKCKFKGTITSGSNREFSECVDKFCPCHQIEPKNQESEWEKEFWQIVEEKGVGAHIDFCRALKSFIRNLLTQTRQDLKNKVLGILRKEEEENSHSSALECARGHCKYVIADIKTKIEKEI